MALASISHSRIQYHKRRYVVYGMISFFVFCLPFVTVNGNQIFLLSFVHEQLHLFGVVFNTQELYLMPFLLMLLFIGIFFMTTLGGRVWCGWSCPQTIFRVVYRDLIETKLLGLRKKIANKQIEPDMSIGLNKIKKVIAFLIWCVLALLAASNFLWYFVPPSEFFEALKDPFEHEYLLGFLGAIAGFLIADIVFFKENFCIYVCPYSRIQSVLYDDDTVMVAYDYKRGGEIYDHQGIKLWKKPKIPEAECTGCEACVRVCPTHIDIRKGMQLECINCLECADACSQVMGKLGKFSLINWTSSASVQTRQKVQYFRFKTIAYLGVLSLVFGILLYLGSTKESMLLNINRNQLYTLRENHEVENSYIFLFQNTDQQAHNFYFEIDHPSIMIKRPSKPFRVKPGEKLKQVVVLRTHENLSLYSQKDTNIPITIRAFSTDEHLPQKIEIFRKSVFVYPPMTK